MLSLKYNKKKMYIRFATTLLALLVLATLIGSTNDYTIVKLIILIGIIAGTVVYGYMRYRAIQKCTDFLRCDDVGIYTNESFVFCPYTNIRGIELRRHMGYKTLFFEVREANLKSKMKPIKKGGWHYYCLPLADCKGNANKNHLLVLDFYVKNKKY